MAKVTEYSDLWQVALVMEPSNSLKGRSFSVTGHLGVSREDLVRVIENAGGRFEERPRYGTTYLITNKVWNKGSTVEAKKSSKLIEAERNGIKIINEAQFCKLVIDNDDSPDAVKIV